MQLWSHDPRHKRRRFLFGFITSYYFILIIPFILVFFTYNTAANVIVKQSDNEVHTALEQVSTLTDADLKGIQTIPLSLKQDEDIQNFYVEWFQHNETVFPAYKADHAFPRFESVNSMIDKVQIVYGCTGDDPRFMTISNNNAMLYSGSLLRYNFEDTNVTFPGLFQILQESISYEGFVSLPSSKHQEPEVYYVEKIESNPASQTSAYVLIHLSSDYMQSLLSSASYDGKGFVFVLDPEYELLYQDSDLEPEGITADELIEKISSTDQTHFEMDDYYINLVTSDYSGWTYCSAVPKATVMKDLNHVKVIVGEVSIVFFILSLIICSLLTMRNSRPLMRILKALMEAYPEPDYFDTTADFRFLETAVTDLVQKKATLSQEETRQVQLYDNHVLRHLMLGRDLKSEDFLQDLARSSLKLEGKTMMVIYLHIYHLGSENSDLTAEMVAAIFHQANEITGTTFYSIPIDPDNYVSLVTYADPKSTEQIPAILDQLSRGGTQAEDEYHFHPDFYISTPFSAYEKCHDAYIECKNLAMKVARSKDRYVYSSLDVTDQPAVPVVHFSINQEIRLSQLIRYGSEDKLNELLEEIRYQNYELSSISTKAQAALFDLIQNGLYRGLSDNINDGAVYDLITSIPEMESYDQVVNTIHQLKEQMHQYLQQDRVHSNLDELHERILNYINTNYRNSNLNQAFLCEELGISETLVTNMFRNIGSSFHIYLENVRIDAACTLLNDNVAVKTVAERVGYTSDVSFRRAFKRVLGISPSAYTKTTAD